MPVWSDTSHVLARLTYGELTDTSTPSTANVEEWLNEAEAETRGILRGVELPVDYTTGSDGELQLRKHVVEYALGLVLMAWNTADGEGEGINGEAYVDAYNARLVDMQERPAAWGARLGATGQSPVAARQARSHAVTGGVAQRDSVYQIDKLDRGS